MQKCSRWVARRRPRCMLGAQAPASAPALAASNGRGGTWWRFGSGLPPASSRLPPAPRVPNQPPATLVAPSAIPRHVAPALLQLELPMNPLDTLIDQLGGPAAVAEMTGRKGRLVRSKSSAGVVYQLRNAEGVAPGEGSGACGCGGPCRSDTCGCPGVAGLHAGCMHSVTTACTRSLPTPRPVPAHALCAARCALVGPLPLLTPKGRQHSRMRPPTPPHTHTPPPPPPSNPNPKSQPQAPNPASPQVPRWR